MAVARVINYGEPIPARDLPYIFDRFHRVDKSRSEQTGGTGLGLAIARNIAELHGGAIEASSRRMGYGTRMSRWKGSFAAWRSFCRSAGLRRLRARRLPWGK